MVLVIHVENTTIVFGIYDGNQLLYHWKVATSRKKTADEWAMQIKSLFEHEKVTFDHVQGIIISSVVPMIMHSLTEMCHKYFHVKPMIIGPGIKTGLNIKYDNPKEVGADRIVNAVAATAMYDGPLIIVDLGTAITYCYINDRKEYIGGAIAPGLSISTEALYTHAAKLPRIEVRKPSHIIGRNTVDAMQAGIFYGFVGQVEGVIGQMKKQLQIEPTVIATGELARQIAEEAKSIHVVEPFLTLKGLRFIYEKNM